MSTLTSYVPPRRPRGFWCSLTSVEQWAFVTSARRATFSTGSVLRREGDAADTILLIESGWTKVCVDSAGRERILAVRGADELIGVRAALRVDPRSVSVIALSPVQALLMTTESFADFLAEHPRVFEVLEPQVHHQLAKERSSALPGEPVEHRLASLVLGLVLREGADDGPLATLTLPITHRDLASWADVPVRTVSQILIGWHAQRLVWFSSGQITVIDIGALMRICGRSAPDPPVRAVPTVSLEGGRPPTPPDAPSAPTFPFTWSGQNCSILLTDIAAFGAPHRDDYDRQTIRGRMYEMLRDAFESSNVPWTRSYREDRGDGALIVVPPTIPTFSIVDPMFAHLTAALRRHNRQASDAVRIQLRLALNVGPIIPDSEGISGESIIHTARLLNAPFLKEQLAATAADLGVIVSTFVYDTVVKHGPGYVDPTEFQQVNCQVKESEITAWMHLAGSARPPIPLRSAITHAHPDATPIDGVLALERKIDYNA